MGDMNNVLQPYERCISLLHCPSSFQKHLHRWHLPNENTGAGLLLWWSHVLAHFVARSQTCQSKREAIGLIRSQWSMSGQWTVTNRELQESVDNTCQKSEHLLPVFLFFCSYAMFVSNRPLIYPVDVAEEMIIPSLTQTQPSKPHNIYFCRCSCKSIN